MSDDLRHRVEWLRADLDTLADEAQNADYEVEARVLTDVVTRLDRALAGPAVEPRTEPQQPDDDDLQQLIARVDAERPGVREAREDMRHLHQVVDDLIEFRRSSGLSQVYVAERMDVKQPTISQFENEGSDPRVSTLQRYARALGLRLVIVLALECPQVSVVQS